jgi:hypothetical protein
MKQSYSNVPATCGCHPCQPIKTETGVRCAACMKPPPQLREQIVARAKEVRESVDKTNLPAKYR